MRQIEGGCENLRYGIHYNADENTIEATFSFTSEIPRHDDGIVDIRPFAHILSYGRKRKGSKPAIDTIFDNPKKAAEITRRAELLFSEELGWAKAFSLPGSLFSPQHLNPIGAGFTVSHRCCP